MDQQIESQRREGRDLKKKIVQIFNSLARSGDEINTISIVARFPYIFIMVAGINILNIASFLLFINRSSTRACSLISIKHNVRVLCL